MTDIVPFLQGHSGVMTALAVLIGLVVGSFLNVVIHRLPRMMEREWREQAAGVLDEARLDDCARELRSELAAPTRYNLILPPSSCPECGHRIRAAENIPIISYLLLRGRCSNCKAPISVRYPIIEGVSGLLAGVVAWHFGFAPAALGAAFFAWALLALTMIDVDTQLLPDDITLPLLWVGLLFNFWSTFAALPEAVTGAAAGYLSLWA
ncbi:MAG: prepilin peptidase, partial [Candidatus Binatia bacterium]